MERKETGEDIFFFFWLPVDSSSSDNQIRLLLC